MSVVSFMDPLNWSFRYYLIKAIEKVGFENGWKPIIEKVDLLTKTLLKVPFSLEPEKCHLFYLQMLAEFGDFRRFSDPLTEPSQEIKDKIKRMRRAQLRHDLLITNNSLRYNNYILHHHNEKFTSSGAMKWTRFAEPEHEDKGHEGFLAQICARARTQDWAANLPKVGKVGVKDSKGALDGKGAIGLKDMSLDALLARCISGVIATPMELMRDVFHLIVNLEMEPPTEREKAAIEAMRSYFIGELRSRLEEDPTWAAVSKYIEGTDTE